MLGILQVQKCSWDLSQSLTQEEGKQDRGKAEDTHNEHSKGLQPSGQFEECMGREGGGGYLLPRVHLTTKLREGRSLE